MKKTLTAALLAATTAGSAMAADLPSRRAVIVPPPPPILTWSGFHIGLNAGGVFGGSSTASTFGANTFSGAIVPGVTPAIDASLTNNIGTGSRTGAILGAQVGYDYQFYNSFLIGIEGDAQGIISPSSIGPVFNTQPFAGAFVTTLGTVQKRTEWLGTLRARLGYTFAPAFLIYATGGLAVGGVKSSTSFGSTFGPPGATAAILSGNAGGYSTNRAGYAVGGGGEWMFSPGWSLKAEYLYYNLGSGSYNAGVNNTFAAPAGALIAQEAVRTRVKFDGHIARLGVNYHFWAPAPLAPVVARY